MQQKQQLFTRYPMQMAQDQKQFYANTKSCFYKAVLTLYKTTTFWGIKLKEKEQYWFIIILSNQKIKGVFYVVTIKRTHSICKTKIQQM